MDKCYNHSQFEDEIYQLWEKHHAFNPDLVPTHPKQPASPSTTASKRQPFCIIMPPPNANDPLHIGHAMFVAIEDVLIRFHRMLGHDTLWLPGTDHAGIETQYVFEKKLKQQGKSRFQFDRETLYQMIWDYVQENSQVAQDQIKKLGASADWSRFKFTLDPKIVTKVLDTFDRLNEKGFIYRANRLVNYCPKCGTAFSNLEVSHIDNTTKLYYVKYGPLTLATTRPETMFADTGLAVHPQDKRYQQYIGQTITCTGLFGQYQLKVIADEFVDPEFGTGVVKITPYHDFHDFEVWQRHQQELPAPKMGIDYQGRLTAIAGKYQGLKAHIAREAVVKDLAATQDENGQAMLVKVQDNYRNNIGVCYRCKTVIEPLPLPQFYVKVKPLTQPVLEALAKNEVKIHGAGHDKTLNHWLEILEDWNISRQIVWGIRIPVWYCVEDNPNIQVNFVTKTGEKKAGVLGDLLKENSLAEIKKGLQSITAPAEAQYQVSRTEPKSANKHFIQETDTFDTWFSSSQWPVVTLQTSSAKQQDFDRFYPTAVMETAYDILMFWVMRMLMMGQFSTGQMPFKDVYLHGLIRDAKGAKMSKSKGNVVNPLEITSKFGTDALRMALIIRSSPGLDKSVGEPDFKAARNLTNKLWNASRYILLMKAEAVSAKPTEADRLFKEKLNQIAADITRQLRHFKIGLAAETVYNEFWHWYCDQCIEQAKTGQLSQNQLLAGLLTFLKLFHPFIPFVTETIWQELRKNQLVDEELLITSSWPRGIKTQK